MTRRREAIYLAVVAVLIADVAAAQPYGSDRAFERYRLTAKGGGLGVLIDETIVFSAVHQKGADQARYWIAEKSHRDENWCGDHDPVSRACLNKVNVTHEWIDGRRCPRLLSSLTKLTSLPPLVFVTPTDMRPLSYISETPEISLTAPAATGDGVGVSVIRRELQGPLVRSWVELSSAVSTCWMTTPVVIGTSP